MSTSTSRYTEFGNLLWSLIYVDELSTLYELNWFGNFLYYLIISWYLHVWNGVAVAAYIRLTSWSQVKFQNNEIESHSGLRAQKYRSHPPSCFVDRQRTTFHTSRNNYVKCDVEKRPLLRPTDKRGKQPPTNFVSCLENAWERPLGQCVSDSHPHTSEARIEVNDRRIPNPAQVWLRTETGMWLNFIVLKFRLGSASEPNVCSHCYDVLNEDMYLQFLSFLHTDMTQVVDKILPHER